MEPDKAEATDVEGVNREFRKSIEFVLDDMCRGRRRAAAADRGPCQVPSVCWQDIFKVNIFQESNLWLRDINLLMTCELPSRSKN